MLVVGKRTRREEKSDGMTCQKVNDRLIFTAFTFRLQLCAYYTSHSHCAKLYFFQIYQHHSLA